MNAVLPWHDISMSSKIEEKCIHLQVIALLPFWVMISSSLFTNQLLTLFQLSFRVLFDFFGMAHRRTGKIKCEGRGYPIKILLLIVLIISQRG